MNTPSSLAFGAQLRQRRLLAGLSQEALAERAGLSVDSIRALERGRRGTARPETLALLAGALGLSAEERARFMAAAIAPPPAPTPPAIPDLLPIADLPIPPTPLIGREHEEAAVAQLLGVGGARLVTITGPGGVGKTRLALQVAATLRGDYPDGVAFVELSTLRDPAFVASAIARALGVRENDGGVLDRVLTHLGTRRALLVLDNFEHLPDASPLVATLLERCPGLALLVSSRMPLRLRAEQRFALASLPVPAARTEPTVDEAAGFAAVRLFVTRARAIRPDFALDTGNTAAVVQICRRLDGLPLALELAAARIALLPPQALAGLLDRRLQLLVGGARDLPPRQRTLRAAITWSHEALTASEQALFARLGIFAGGCTLAAAEAICTLPGDAALDVFEGVSALVDKSLLRPLDDAAGEPRIRMLETIREYAREQSDARGESATLACAHAAYYLALAREAEPHYQDASEAAWLARLDADHDNLRAALAWGLKHDAETGLAVAAALWQFWWVRGFLTEGRVWLERLLARVPDASPARAKALLGAGYLAMQQSGWGVARAHLEEGLALSRAHGDPRLTAWLLRELGFLLTYTSDYEAARAPLEEALALGRALADPQALEAALLNLARLARNRGEVARGRAYLDEALAVARTRGSARAIAAILVALGDLARSGGDLPGAAAAYEEALTAASAVGHTPYRAWALVGLGQVALWHGETARARGFMEEGLGLYRALGNAHSTGFVLHLLGLAAWRAGEYEQATARLRDALAVRWRLGGRAGTAATLEGLALVAARQGRQARATRLVAAAAGGRAAIGAPASPLEQADVDAAIHEAREVLGEQAYADAWTRGAGLSLEQAVAEALDDEQDVPGDRPS